MDFNYYSFFLNGEERIFYTYVELDTDEILEWAVNYGFIDESDIEKCNNIRALTPSEVEERNKELYREWWEEHKNNTSLSGKIPPTIGEAQLN